MRAVQRLMGTRLDLLRAEQRLARLAKSTNVLRRKREALVAELFPLARRAADARAAIAERTDHAYPALLNALGARGRVELRAVARPGRDLRVEVRAAQVWGVAVADIIDRPRLRRTLAARGTLPGMTGPAATTAAREFEQLADLLLDAAPREMLMRRLGQALAQTTRLVNSLEQRLAPALRGEIRRVRQGLEEREREEHVRTALWGKRKRV